ncbi:hypothetical protein MY11210_004116 [Beauveria gryllotalpidicola]
MSTHQSSAQAGSGLSFCTATLSDAAAVRALVVSAFRGASSRAGWTTEADLFTDERVSEDGVVEKIKRADSQVVMVLDETNILLGCAEICIGFDMGLLLDETLWCGSGPCERTIASTVFNFNYA